VHILVYNSSSFMRHYPSMESDRVTSFVFWEYTLGEP